MVTIVVSSSFSFRNIYAKRAVINGIALIVKRAFATEVVVIACKKKMLALPRRIPPQMPGQPMARICVIKGVCVLIIENKDTVKTRATDR